jgi:hypothetical protein
MPSTYKEPTLIEDIGALADLYVGVFKMMGRRLDPRASKKQTLRVLPEDLLPPPLPDREVQKEPTRPPELAHRT